MKTEQKYRCDIRSGKMVKAYTIKEIFQDNWGDFVLEMSRQGKKIRKTILEEVDKVMKVQDVYKVLTHAVEEDGEYTLAI